LSKQRLEGEYKNLEDAKCEMEAFYQNELMQTNTKLKEKTRECEEL